MPIEYKDFDNDNKCPKCGLSGASVDYAGSLIENQPIIVRQCMSCGFTRGELAVDDDEYGSHP